MNHFDDNSGSQGHLRSIVLGAGVEEPSAEVLSSDYRLCSAAKDISRIEVRIPTENGSQLEDPEEEVE